MTETPCCEHTRKHVGTEVLCGGCQCNACRAFSAGVAAGIDYAIVVARQLTEVSDD